jgi:hypothetical protein
MAVIVREPNRTPLVLTVHEPLEIGRDCSGLLLRDSSLSRRHLLLEPMPDGVVVSDLNSRNGTTLDNEPLRLRHRLGTGEVIRFGSCTLEWSGRTASRIRHRLIPIAAPTALSRLGVEVAVGGEINGGRSSFRSGLDLQSGKTLNKSTEARMIAVVASEAFVSREARSASGHVHWSEVRRVHSKILRSMLVRHRGVEVASMDEGFVVAFQSTTIALAFVDDLRNATANFGSANPGLQHDIRIGVDLVETNFPLNGSATLDWRPDWRSVFLTAARIALAAQRNEILVSEIVSSFCVSKEWSIGARMNVRDIEFGLNYRVRALRRSTTLVESSARN